MDKQYLLTMILTIVFVVAAYFMGYKNATSASEVSNTNLDNSIALAIEYLSKSVSEKGRFLYKANIDPDIKYSEKKYNALRHAGTLYSMYLCERVLGNNSLKEKRYLASEYFIKNYVKEIKPNIYAVVSKPEEEDSSTEQAKVGGAGLALIGLSNLYPEGKIDLRVLRGLGDFTVFMQNEDGSFVSKYNVTKDKKDSKFVSLYYPGEVAYGLLFLNEVDPQKKWVNTAKKTLLYLASSRQNNGRNVPYDHWAMLATKKLFETPDNGLTQVEKIQLQRHAEQIAYSIIDNQFVDEGYVYKGGFIDNLRLCSIGTIMEGYVAIYHITDNEELKQRVLTTLRFGNDFLSRFQLKEGAMRGGIPTTAYWQLSNAPQSSKVIRIDNVQHVLSAWITFKELEKSLK